MDWEFGAFFYIVVAYKLVAYKSLREAVDSSVKTRNRARGLVYCTGDDTLLCAVISWRP